MYACNSAILAVLAFSIPRSNNARLPMCLSLYMYLYLHLYLLAHNQTLDSTHARTHTHTLVRGGDEKRYTSSRYDNMHISPTWQDP